MLILPVLIILTFGTSKSMIIEVDKKGLITGRVSNFTSNLPIEFVAVDVYNAQDSTLVVGTLTDTEGQFTVSMLDSGKYYVEINQHNFEKNLIYPVIIGENTEKVNLGEIMLFPMPCKQAKFFSRKTVRNVHGEPQKILCKN